MRRLVLLLAFLSISTVLSMKAQSASTTYFPACSYTALNGNCRLTIDRLNPETPPTIHILPKSAVRVEVVNSYGLERLTLDWKSSAVVVPPDVFQGAFTALSPNLESLQFLALSKIDKATTLNNADKTQNTGKTGKSGKVSPDYPPINCEDTPIGCTTAQSMSDAQMRIAAQLRGIPSPYAVAKPAIESIKLAQQPPQGGRANVNQPWHDPEQWKTTTSILLRKGIPAPSVIVPIKLQLTTLDVNIANITKAAKTVPELKDAATITSNQATLNANTKALNDASAKLTDLADAIIRLDTSPVGIRGNAFITLPQPANSNYHTQTWTLNYTNKLAPLAKRFAADPVKSEDNTSMASLADAPNKQPITTITVQFEAPSRIEVTTGLMVPAVPLHTYAVAPVVSGSVVTDNVVQQADTYSVVPMVLIHWRAKQWIVKKQSTAFFLTGGLGVNSVTSQVEFGGGLTFSYRFMAISALADIGRDTKLTGSFTVNQSLGLTPATPTTSTGWGVKPAGAISVRIPLGSSGGK